MWRRGCGGEEGERDRKGPMTMWRVVAFSIFKCRCFIVLTLFHEDASEVQVQVYFAST